MMEQMLETLFDFQLFEQDRELAELIGQTEARYAAELSDEELELVAAAGTPNKTHQIQNIFLK